MLRIALIVTGIGVLALLVMVAGCRPPFCPRAWDSPPESLRRQLYELLAQNRFSAAALLCAYGIAVVAAFRREIWAASSRTTVIRLLVLLVIAAALAGASLLVSVASP